MLELTKSTISLSWALSLLGMKEMASLLGPRSSYEQRGNCANACDPVTEAALQQLDPSLQGLFRTGDSFQRGVMNMMFGFFNPGNWNLGLRTPADGRDPSSSTQATPEWGPMPPRA